MRFFEVSLGPRIDPKNGLAPLLRFRHGHRRGISRRRVPGGRVSIIDGLADCRKKGNPEKEEDLPNEQTAHGLVRRWLALGRLLRRRFGASIDPEVRVKGLGRIFWKIRLDLQDRVNRPAAFGWRDGNLKSVIGWVADFRFDRLIG